jgi:hypothetical protein
MSAAPSPRARQRSVDSPIDADEGAAAERDCVRGEVGVEVVVRQLEPWDEEEVVFVPGPRCFCLDLEEIGAVVVDVNVTWAGVGLKPGVVGAHAVVGDAEDIEPAPPVQVDELWKRELAVAPRRVRVQLAEQRLDSPAHLARLCLRDRPGWADEW